MRIGPQNHNLACFQRLTQGFQNMAWKFGQFVQKQYAIMRQ